MCDDDHPNGLLGKIQVFGRQLLLSRFGVNHLVRRPALCVSEEPRTSVRAAAPPSEPRPCSVHVARRPDVGHKEPPPLHQPAAPARVDHGVSRLRMAVAARALARPPVPQRQQGSTTECVPIRKRPLTERRSPSPARSASKGCLPGALSEVLPRSPGPDPWQGIECQERVRTGSHYWMPPRIDKLVPGSKGQRCRQYAVRRRLSLDLVEALS